MHEGLTSFMLPCFGNGMSGGRLTYRDFHAAFLCECGVVERVLRHSSCMKSLATLVQCRSRGWDGEAQMMQEGLTILVLRCSWAWGVLWRRSGQDKSGTLNTEIINSKSLFRNPKPLNPKP